MLPGGVMATMDGQQGAELLRIVRPHQAVPVHYEDYPVLESPLSDFVAAVAERGLQERVTYVHAGDTALLRPAKP